MKWIWVPVAILVLSLAVLVPLAFDLDVAGWAGLDARSELASKYLYENSGSYR